MNQTLKRHVAESIVIATVLRDLKYVSGGLASETARLIKIDELTLDRHGITKTPRNPDKPSIWSNVYTFADGSSANGKLPSKELTWGVNGHLKASTDWMIKRVERMLEE